MRYGWAVTKQVAEGIELLNKAAAQNQPDALNELGLLERNGVGAERNYEKALKLFTSAAELNHAAAQQNLAAMYEQGLGVEKNPAKALEWKKKAGEGNTNRPLKPPTPPEDRF